ncbi:MAG TPA: exodeoxyribonuclease VII small subunit [Lentimicrobium sp.]|nr:exodeoxyribonuclease VII small subunit [Lentimicrobium sp.]
MENRDEQLTYATAVNELEQIIAEMEDASVGVDELTEKVKRASLLLQFCRNKLTSTEQEVNNILRNFEKESDNRD